MKKTDFLKNEDLLNKAKEELQFCENRKITPEELIITCLAELEQQGFLNLLEGESEEHMYQIRDQRD